MKAHRPGEILVVDGSSDFLTFAATALHRRGHAVRVCAYAAEARRHIERHFFDAVLCGLELPDASGAEFCSWIKSSDELQGLPVAMVVDAAKIKHPDDPLEAIMRDIAPGAPVLSGPLAPDEFILRPVRPEEFVVRVGALLKMRRYREEIGNAITTLLAIAEGIEEQDRRARGHCRRLSIMGVLLGAAAGLDEYQLLVLERAGFLHDIGKACIPGAILEKSQPLTPREMEIVREHPILGEKLCRPVMALEPVISIVRHHHERGDGSGYPDGLKMAKIPRLTQLFSIVDVYDSLRTWRPYRPPLQDWQALDVMSGEIERGFWNRELFELFVSEVVPTLDAQFAEASVSWPGE